MRWPGIALAWGLVALGCLPEPPPLTSPAVAGDAEPQVGEVLWAGKAVADLYAPGEVRAFEFRQAGHAIGRSWGRYDGPVDRNGQTLHRFSTRIVQVPSLEAADLVARLLRGAMEQGAQCD